MQVGMNGKKNTVLLVRAKVDVVPHHVMGDGARLTPPVRYLLTSPKPFSEILLSLVLDTEISWDSSERGWGPYNVVAGTCNHFEIPTKSHDCTRGFSILRSSRLSLIFYQCSSLLGLQSKRG